MSESLSDGVVKPRDKGNEQRGSGGESRAAEETDTARPTVHIEALDSSAPVPVSPSDKELDVEELEQEISDMTELEKKVSKLEEELEKYKPTDRTPMVANPESPSAEERERHELTHANHKSWCKHCQKALAMRDKHVVKGQSATKRKYRNKEIPKNSRLDLFYENYPRYHNERTYEAVDEYFKIAQKYKISLSQLSLAFVNSRDFVTSNIIGATTMEQLKENIDSINIELTEEILDKINKIHDNNNAGAVNMKIIIFLSLIKFIIKNELLF